MAQDTLVWYMKLFHFGGSNAATSKELESTFGVRGVALRRQINALRREGVPIASDENGYYYAETELEVRRTLAHMTRRVAGIAAAIRGLERSLERFDSDQLRLPLGGGGGDAGR